VLLVAVLHFLWDEEDRPESSPGCARRWHPAAIWSSRMPPRTSTRRGGQVTEVYDQASAPLALRIRSQIEGFFNCPASLIHWALLPSL
jgi:hypothetical protein